MTDEIDDKIIEYRIKMTNNGKSVGAIPSEDRELVEKSYKKLRESLPNNLIEFQHREIGPWKTVNRDTHFTGGEKND